MGQWVSTGTFLEAFRLQGSIVERMECLTGHLDNRPASFVLARN